MDDETLKKYQSIKDRNLGPAETLVEQCQLAVETYIRESGYELSKPMNSSDWPPESVMVWVVPTPPEMKGPRLFVEVVLSGEYARACREIEHLRGALKKFGQHPTGDMEGVGRCAGFRLAAPFRDELCNCGLNAALGPSDQKGVLTITRDVTTVSPNFRVTATTVSDVARGPCALCGRTDNP